MATHGNTWAILSHYCHRAQLPINAAQGAIWAWLFWNKSTPLQTSPNTWVVAGCRHTKKHSITFPSVQAWSHFIIARGAPVPTVMRQLDCFALEAAPCAPQIYRSFARLNSIAVLVVKRLDLRDSKTAQNNCLLVPLLHAMHTCGCKNSLLCKPSFKLHLANAGRLRKRCWTNSAQAKRSIKCINQVFPIFPLAFTARTS